ncbi:MAG: ATP-grasp domain-containing protein [Candidatus Omnitrophota bacterium]|nr:MAG: ATP-grasp domain-containing protein [Candidatus Omnitrophota bacterium]
MKIGITYNLKDDLSPDAIVNDEFAEEFDSAATIDAICGVLQQEGYDSVKLGGTLDIVGRINKENIDFVFNIAEGACGRNRESHVPSLLEMCDMPYSGSDPLTLGLTLDKIMTKKIAYYAGIPTPNYKVIWQSEDLKTIENVLRYPLITKPAWEGSSKGIYNSSKVSDGDNLKKNVKLLREKYPHQPILVEEYIEGKEITVGVIGNNPAQILGVMEIVNKHLPGEDLLYSLEVKKDWRNLVDYLVPANVGKLEDRHIRHYALSAFREFGCRDIARVDFKLSRSQNKIFLLEINPLPGLSPEYADLVIMSRKAGIEYRDLVLSILYQGFSRYESLGKMVKISRVGLKL